ncbi:MAG: response regulator [Anaerolineae bacterium]
MEINNTIPDWLNAVIMKSLEKLPENRYPSAAAMAAALQGPDPSAAPTMQLTERQPRIRVILADDHAIIRTAGGVSGYDGRYYRRGEASNGEEAIELAKEVSPDVVLLDLNMPKITGMMALPQIKKNNPNAKVLILTGRDETPLIMQALRNGANGYILKTASEQELLKAVRDVYSGGLVLGQGIAEKLVDGIRNIGAVDPLTADEHDVLRYIAAGVEDNAEIAKRLNTTDTQVTRLLMTTMEKLGVANRADAALMALRAGWI